MGHDDAGSRLRLLRQEYLELPARGPGDGRTATRVHAPAPLNLAVLDHIDASVHEVVKHVRAVRRDAGPVPGEVSRVYAWWRDSTPDLDAAAVRARETVIYRQNLEHAIAAGDYTVVCKHPCPACGCWGLAWRASAGRAACLNLDCTDANGMTSTWELKHLAHEYVTRREAMLETRAT